MTMHKKDYEAIARAIDVLADTWQSARGTTRYDESEVDGAILALEQVAQEIATYCESRDREFKRDRFLAACGVSQS